jgi:hypothetical protein
MPLWGLSLRDIAVVLFVGMSSDRTRLWSLTAPSHISAEIPVKTNNRLDCKAVRRVRDGLIDSGKVVETIETIQGKSALHEAIYEEGDELLGLGIALQNADDAVAAAPTSSTIPAPS